MSDQPIIILEAVHNDTTPEVRFEVDAGYSVGGRQHSIRRNGYNALSFASFTTTDGTHTQNGYGTTFVPQAGKTYIFAMAENALLHNGLPIQIVIHDDTAGNVSDPFTVIVGEAEAPAEPTYVIETVDLETKQVDILVEGSATDVNQFSLMDGSSAPYQWTSIFKDGALYKGDGDTYDGQAFDTPFIRFMGPGTYTLNINDATPLLAGNSVVVFDMNAGSNSSDVFNIPDAAEEPPAEDPPAEDNTEDNAQQSGSASGDPYIKPCLV